eukprot:Skav220472  [mRNA]  locus=scaffold96:243231:244007:+ [translate_table: standard]
MTAPCCPPGSHGPLPPDDAVLSGWSERRAEMDCYFTGQKENPTMIILGFSDVFGPMSGRHRRVCDEMAAAIPGSLVCLPDLFGGEPICPDFFGSRFPALRLKLFLPKMVYRIRYRYGWATLGPKIQALVDSFGMEPPPLCSFGFCFGAYVAVKASSTGAFRGVVGFHPSLLVGSLQCSPHSEKDCLSLLSTLGLLSYFMARDFYIPSDFFVLHLHFFHAQLLSRDEMIGAVAMNGEIPIYLDICKCFLQFPFTKPGSP